MIEKKSAYSIIFDIFLTLFMFGLFVIFVYPFLYVLVYSISDVSQMKSPLLIFPVGINFESYKTIFRDTSFVRSTIITLARCTLGPLGMLLISGSGAYALSRQNLVFGKAVRMYFLFSMYVSAGLIPGFLLIKYLGLMNNFWVYIIPGLANIFTMLLIKAYISSLPRELEEAVLIDGGTDFDVYFRVILPLTLPINAAVVLFAVIGHWNSYIDVTLFNGNSPNLYTLSFKLYLNLTMSLNMTLEDIRRMHETGQIVSINAKSMNMAMTVITIAPIMCLYPLLQKYFASGLLIGSIKM